MGRGAALPGGAAGQARRSRADGHPDLRGLRRRRHVGGGLLHLALEELARVDPSVSLSVAAHNGLGAAHIAMFGSEAQKQRYVVPLAGGEQARRVGADRGRVGQRRRGDADDGRARRRRLGAERRQELHHPRHFGRHPGGDGGDRQEPAATRASRRSSSSAARPGLRAGKKEDKLGMRASETAEVLFRTCRIPARSADRRGRAGVHPDAAGARRRPHRHRRAGRRPGAGRLRSASRRYAFERRQFGRADRHVSVDSLPSWSTTPPASRRRGC